MEKYKSCSSHHQPPTNYSQTIMPLRLWRSFVLAMSSYLQLDIDLHRSPQSSSQISSQNGHLLAILTHPQFICPNAQVSLFLSNQMDFSSKFTELPYTPSCQLLLPRDRFFRMRHSETTAAGDVDVGTEFFGHAAMRSSSSSARSEFL